MKINGPLVLDGDVENVLGGSFAMAPDVSHVVYMADQEVNEGIELFSTRLAPTVTAIAAKSGPPAGGNSVTITGCGFLPASVVRFGDKLATSVTFVSSTELEVVVPRAARPPRPTTGSASGKLRQAQIGVPSVDVTGLQRWCDWNSRGGYTYLPHR